MRDKIYEILKIIQKCKSCEECPLYYFCDIDEGICDYLESLDNKLLDEQIK